MSGGPKLKVYLARNETTSSGFERHAPRGTLRDRFHRAPLGTGWSFRGQAGTDKEVIVDRLISISEVEAPAPGQMTRDVVDAYRQECRRAPMCMPNAEAYQRKIQFYVPEDHIDIL